ncbi:MAG TPA: family 16 glycoside hydrolase [Planctomycetaceae bacterium]|jgi:type 1 glutamine amidotransferase|nr:family 16 glycoside hydrolase [Planctomycetaceae bacterium]
MNGSTVLSRLASRALPFVALVAIITLASAPLRADDASDGFKSLFNGTDLAGWDGNPMFWSVRDGAITGQTTAENPTKGNTFLIWKDGTVDDFELRLSYKIIGGNSGIQYRSKDLGNWVVGGYQGDFEAGDTYSGILYEEKGRGILAQRGQKTEVGPDGKVQVVATLGDTKDIQAGIKKEDWNEYTILAQGNQLTHIINGRVTAQVTDMQPEKRAKSGILALQLHAGPPMTVQFKNVRIRRLKMTAGTKKIVLVAGSASHGVGAHEFSAGVRLLKKCLDNVPGVVAAQYFQGWPTDPSAFDNADAILFYMDGGAKHPLIQGDHLIQINKLVRQGVGIACVHYAVEIPKDRGGPELLSWIGGYFEQHWSVNPHWTAKFDKFPEHPITRGVKPFEINDEWYYHMRFRENMDGVTPLLTDVPPASTLDRPDGPASGNPHVRAKVGQPQHMAWAVEREDGGRGFGFTGGHVHRNWGDDNFRKLVLNALLWVAKAEVPEGGVVSTVTEDDLKENLDPKGK